MADPAAPAAGAGSAWPAWRQALALAALAVLAYLPGIGAQEFVGTEDFRARIAAETVASEHPLLPTYYGRPILTKPPLHYWALGGVQELAGTRAPWSARLLSLAALAATVAMSGAAARAAGGPRAGWIAGMGYLLGAYILKNGVNAEIDPLFACFVVGAVLAWWQAQGGESGQTGQGGTARRCVLYAALAGLLAGLAVLTKGPALVPFAAGAAYATWRCGRKPTWAVVAAAVLTFAPPALLWPLALHQLDPEVRALAITEGPGMFFAWDGRFLVRTLLFPVTLFCACLPFTVPALLRLRAPGRAALDRYLMAAVGGAFVLLLLNATKSTRYLLPCFPLLVVAGVLRLELLARTGPFVRAVCVLFLLAAAVAFPLTFSTLSFSGALALAALATAATAGFLLARRAPAAALALLLVPARALFTQVYVPRWEAGEDSVRAGVAELAEQLAGARNLGVATLETPRILDPLQKRITYYDHPKDLAEAVRGGARFDALLLGTQEFEHEVPGFAPAGFVRVGDKHVAVLLPETP
ncbi:MAG: hypothetical protein EYC70_16965 [Planctomycetota bacterium]|nr:MAG: hypothetical protein EYC70_16965 [Planctomycetota bacterium]